MNLVHLIAYLIAAALLLSGCAARPGQIALPDTPEGSESESEETEQPETSEAPITMPVSIILTFFLTFLLSFIVLPPF